MKDELTTLQSALLLVILWALVLLVLQRCAPSVQEFLKNSIDCDVEVTMPAKAVLPPVGFDDLVIHNREPSTIKARAKFTNCVEGK